ncbi:MAG: putative Ig domain-containing protein [Terriglobales bacterium]
MRVYRYRHYSVRARCLGAALAALVGLGLSACGGSTAAPTPFVPATANFLILSSASTGHLPGAVAGSPYAYGFQTNVGQTGVSAIAPVTFSTDAALPQGLILSPAGVLSGTPTQPGIYPIVIKAVDSSSSPQTAAFTYLMKVRAPATTLTTVAHLALGGHGQNADVTVAAATNSGVSYAYVGTRGYPGDCPATGVKIVDLSQISNPTLVATVAGVAGASQQEAKVATSISSPGFHSGSHGDLMAVTEQPCDPRLASATNAAIEFFDVTNPTQPVALGTWSSGGQGVGDVAIVAVPGPVNAFGIVDHSQDKIYALAAVPGSEAAGGEGDLRIVDVTDPSLPREVSNWGVLAATGTRLPQAVQGTDQRVFLSSIQLSSDHKLAYLSYWDEGVVVLDVSDPTAVRSFNPAVLVNHISYPLSSLATTSTPSSPEGNTNQALPVMGDTELLIADQVCASAIAPPSGDGVSNLPLNPSVDVVCGAGSAVPLSNDSGWGYLRTYDLPTPSTSTIANFFDIPQALSDPAPDNGIYTANRIAWNGNTADPHAYVAWFSGGVVDLDITSVNPPVLLGSFVPPDSPDPNGANLAVDNPPKAMVYGVAAYNTGGQHYILASDINSGLWVVQDTPGNQLTILTSSLPDGNVNIPYDASITAINGALGGDRLTFNLATNSNPLPDGLQLDGATGVISGTPLVAGAVDVTFEVDDNAGNATQQTITMTVNQHLAVVPPAAVPLATVGEPYSLTLTAVNGTSPYTFSVVGSALPTGLSLSSAGVVSGTPANAAVVTATIQVTDSSVPTLTARLPVTITVAALQAASRQLLPATVGVAYTATITMANGTGPYTPVVVNGTLPPGINAVQSVATTVGWDLTGTPTQAGVYNFSVQETDADGLRVVEPFTLVVNPFAISPLVLPSGVEGQGYLQQMGIQGGASPFNFSLVGGSLPAGLTINPIGQISGVPGSASAGSYDFTLLVQDANGLQATQSFNLVIFTGATMAITTTGLAPGQVGQTYNAILTANFGNAPYSFSLQTGNLPPGVTLDPNGTLAGVPGASAQGTYAFTIKATDSQGQTATRSYRWTVLPAVSPVITGPH